MSDEQKEPKNLKISAEVHARLKARADRMGMKINRLADAILNTGLLQPDSTLHAAVYEHNNGGSTEPPPFSTTPPGASTNPARRKPRS